MDIEGLFQTIFRVVEHLARLSIQDLIQVTRTWQYNMMGLPIAYVEIVELNKSTNQ